MPASTQTMGVLNASPSDRCSVAPPASRSLSNSPSSHCFSSAVSQDASSGLSFKRNKTENPARNVGTPSTKNSHCQPWRLLCPSSFSSALAMGAPMTPAIEVAVIKIATALARSCEGNQKVRYRIIPGKKPASATPSRKRMSSNE